MIILENLLTVCDIYSEVYIFFYKLYNIINKEMMFVV